jgi:hypothetical protein
MIASLKCPLGRFKVSITDTLVKSEATSKLAMKPSGQARKNSSVYIKSVKFYT